MNISLPTIHIQAGGVVLIDNSSISFKYGKRYGLVGRNGVGKSTLLQYLQTEITRLDENITILQVEQEVNVDSDSTVFDYVICSNNQRNQLLARHQELINISEHNVSTLQELGEVETKLRIFDRDPADVHRILTGLGFTLQQQEMSINNFSGGWRVKVSLARALYMKPHVLLLDEPTNHLDISNIWWLSSYLKKWPNILVVISHDAEFLDEVCSNIIHLENKNLTAYRGNYSHFKVEYAQHIRQMETKWNKWETKLKLLKAQHKPKEEIEKLFQASGLQKIQKDHLDKLEFINVKVIPSKVITFTNVAFCYDDNNVFENLNWDINMKSRFAVVGPNGCGKSTLLKLLVGHLSPQSGTIYKDSQITLGYFSQHSHEQLPLDKTAVEYLSSVRRNSNVDVRKLLGTVGIKGNLHNNLISTYSGGQKVRLSLLGVIIQEPHIILFDEPSNNLDITMVEEFIRAINAFNGAVILVTHDFNLITATNCEIYEIDDRTLVPTTYHDYKEKVLASLELE